MLYPKFLNSHSTIGITAISAGVGDHIDDFQKSIETLKDVGFSVVETESVRVDGMVSNTSLIRAQELEDLVLDKDIEMIMCATGGDFALEVLPYINFDAMKKNPKWVMGASDPTSLLYVITTCLDIATIYGFNGGSFDDRPLHQCQKNALEIIQGNLIEQKSFEKYEVDKNFDSKKRKLTGEVNWVNLNGDFKVTGRIIGGCIDVLRNLVGTPYDYTESFVKKYKKDGFIWYFDIFSLSSEDFYLALLQMKMAGWFKSVKAVVVGRVMFPKKFNEDFDYGNALIKIFGNIPIVIETDIGHVFPKMTIINGSIANIESVGNKGNISFILK